MFLPHAQKKLILNISLVSAFLVAAASLLGIFWPVIYAQETLSWATQGMGQDVVNLVVAVPVLIISAIYLKKDSLPAVLIWLGTQLYLIYSYFLYSFFVHFGPLFLVYTSILGISVCSFIFVLSSFNYQHLARSLPKGKPVERASLFLFNFALFFTVTWLLEIIPALIAGGAPDSVNEVGAAVNPVHGLDLAIFLPGMASVLSLIKRDKLAGYLMLVPWLVFAATMGLAIIGMMIAMQLEGLAAPIALPIVIAATVVTCIYYIKQVLKSCAN